MKIKNKMVEPCGGWTYIQPETKQLLQGGTWDELIAEVVAHRRKHNLPIGTQFHEDVEKYICQHAPGACGEHTLVDSVVLTTKILESGTKALFKWYSSGKITDQAEADRRAKICVNCPYNIATVKGGCKTCNAVAEVFAEKIQGVKNTPYDHELYNCAICKCYNKVQVWCPKEGFEGSIHAHAYPDNCWKKELA